MARPFAGLKVIDATHVLAGPYCGYQLALLGADTIKIESPHEGDPVRSRGPVRTLNDAGLGMNYLTQNSNKRSLTVDLKTAEGQEIFRTLARHADVVIENFRSGAFDNLGLGYDDIRAINPRVIYCSITAFGATGPDAARTAYDPVIQGVSGIMHSSGFNQRGLPAKSAAPMIDYGVGLSAAFAIASALYQRERTGEGQRIDCSMLELALILMGPATTWAAYDGEKHAMPVEAGTDCYRAKDDFVQLGAYNFRQNRRLWEALGNPQFASYSSWPEIWDNAARMRSELEKIMPTRTADEWERFLGDIGVPGGRVKPLNEAVSTEQVAARGLMHALPPLAGVAGVRVPVAAFAFDHDGPRITSSPPGHGEHNQEILASIGYDEDRIQALKTKQVI
jgi:crotonobetainyl-CoA:carnitine CoA-transferase CaiB-like acyl-CoA transferase